jgi:hypothetical protein
MGNARGCVNKVAGMGLNRLSIYLEEKLTG